MESGRTQVLVEFKRVRERKHMIDLPLEAQKYFWGDDLSDLSWEKHKNYIVQTLLEKGDLVSVRWLFTKISKEEVRLLLPDLHLQPKSSNFWKIYLS
jgi:hypothetical protein